MVIKGARVEASAMAGVAVMGTFFCYSEVMQVVAVMGAIVPITATHAVMRWCAGAGHILAGRRTCLHERLRIHTVSYYSSKIAWAGLFKIVKGYL